MQRSGLCDFGHRRSLACNLKAKQSNDASSKYYIDCQNKSLLNRLPQLFGKIVMSSPAMWPMTEFRRQTLFYENCADAATFLNVGLPQGYPNWMVGVESLTVWLVS